MSTLPHVRPAVEPRRDPIRELLDAWDAEFRPSAPCPSDGGPAWDAYHDQRGEFLASIDDDVFDMSSPELVEAFVSDRACA